MNKNKFNTVVDSNLERILAQKFTRYSKYIIQHRAIPDVRDGLKPVQRRILYSMWQLGLKNSKNYKKSARVVGDVIGKYHPHGDSSIYDALVRMSQEWKMNATLVEMHGNKGSIDDDPAAAMRYTEVRLAEISTHLLELISKNVVSFCPNFDDSEKEPTILPAIFPNLLVNGAIGIASGFATEIPPHNLVEVIDATILMITNPGITVEEISKIILGPDFPTGGIVYGKSGIFDAFKTGKGKIKISADYKIIDQKEQKIIEITSIPYGISKASLIQQIDNIRFEEKIFGIKEVIDQSDQKGILIFIELEKDANPDLIINYLLQKTDIQISYSYNSVAICNNSPKLLSIKEMIFYFLEHFKKIKLTEFDFDLLKSKKRLEIVSGFLKVAEITAEVIKVIQNSDNSKAGVIKDLMNFFSFTEIQAEAIATMRLYRLSKIEQKYFLDEANDLSQKIAEITELIENTDKFNDHLISILKSFKKTYGTPRKTKIIDSDLKIKVNHNELIKDDFFYFWVTKNGLFKKMSLKNSTNDEIIKNQIPEDDYFVFQNKISQKQQAFFITNKANVAAFPVHKIEELNQKQPANNLSMIFGFGNTQQIIDSFFCENFEKNQFFLLVTKQGYVKRVLAEQLSAFRSKKMQNIFKLKENDELISVFLETKLKNLVVITTQNRALKFSVSEIPVYSKNASGIKAIRMWKNEQVATCQLIQTDDFLVVIDGYSRFEKIDTSILRFDNRAASPKNFKTKLDFSLEPKDIEIFNPNLLVFEFGDSIKIFSIDEFLNLKADSKKIYKLFLPIGKNSLVQKEQNLKNNFDETTSSLKEKLEEINKFDVNSILKKLEEDI
ncbi:DNA topoisomerase IV subunit A [Mycoplasma sp. 'Moose RK']|uniref:DNA topoisomerase IV subunit A n=1 Tax=Mycoplasma sp. 'Moose RK' TaxID=2780095 RepID=UPI0018C2416E|nr:DNA topoisomerase IV subunit A [Mycoplasma sp. 'Moose RK']MBG0730542.1 DNA topoisomerase IV subunit A [Mycoplasma sp. 'Moose RK']